MSEPTGPTGSNVSAVILDGWIALALTGNASFLNKPSLTGSGC